MQGIYLIENKINKKKYIGQSNNIKRRISEHFGSSTTSISPALRNAINKYGKENFNSTVLEVIDDHYLLNEREIFWIQELNTLVPNGYNIQPGGSNTSIGETNNNAILTEKEVVEIRLSYKNRERVSEVYNRYSNKITRSAFEGVWQGRDWGHIMPEVYTKESKEYYSKKASSGERGAFSKFTNKEVLELRKRYVNETAKEIYEDYSDKCKYNTLQAMLWGRSYKEVPIYSKKNKTWDRSPE